MLVLLFQQGCPAYLTILAHILQQYLGKTGGLCSIAPQL